MIYCCTCTETYLFHLWMGMFGFRQFICYPASTPIMFRELLETIRPFWCVPGKQKDIIEVKALPLESIKNKVKVSKQEPCPLMSVPHLLPGKLHGGAYVPILWAPAVTIYWGAFCSIHILGWILILGMGDCPVHERTFSSILGPTHQVPVTFLDSLSRAHPKLWQ